jgi:hypothetical protein
VTVNPKLQAYEQDKTKIIFTINRLSQQLDGLTTLHALATPNNANAAAAGVPIGGYYTSTANPAPVYIRTA